jgi:exodeoxyribonuclease VII large subunit
LQQTTTAGERDVFSVSRLSAEARAVIEGSFPLLWVEGEISNLATPRSGHLYFSLKDAHAQVRCALFRGRRQLLRFAPANGDQVLARVKVGFYEPRAEFQLTVEHLEPAGAGSAQRAFEALKAKLQAEGLFDPARKRALPPFPARLGVITSPSGAAIRDVLQVLRQRAPHIAVTIFPARVQGDGAADELREALQLAQRRADCDVLLLTRGGGAAEDLAAFNDERLARAVAASTIPVVSAVGHEIDFTISDFAADRRAPTPSAAAELISPDTAAVRARIDTLARRLRREMVRHVRQLADRQRALQARLRLVSPQQRMRQAQQRLDGLDLRLTRALEIDLERRRQRVAVLHGRLAQHSPARALQLLRQRFAPLAPRLAQAMRGDLRRRGDKLAAIARELHAVSPLATLQRGYSVIRRAGDGRVLARAADTAPGERLDALLGEGRLRLVVDAVDPDDDGDTSR